MEKMIPGRVFKAEVISWSKRIGVEPKEIRIRLMRNKWASCSSNGRLTFNSEILTRPEQFRNEAIVHELLHLKVPNHGKLFQSLIRAYMEK
jgi:predicted metal-dependent hydrolase